MSRLLCACAALLLCAACAAPTSPDKPLTAPSALRADGPFEAAQAWVDKQWVAGATRDPALKSAAWQGAQVEALWREEGGWRALALPTAGGAPNQAILLTIQPAGAAWAVTAAQAAPADLLWPGM